MLLILLFVIGLAIGSFLNVLIDRLPKEQSIFGRSHCDYCKKTLSPIDLIPVASFLILGGKCRRCKKKLSWQYPLIEILTGLTFVLVWVYIPTNGVILSVAKNLWQMPVIFPHAWEILRFTQDDILRIFYLGLFSCFIAIFVADWKYQIIPDELQIATFILTLGILGLSGQLVSFGQIIEQIIAGVGVMSPILGLYLITRGRGMGFADVKFAFIMGILLGLIGGIIALMIGFIIGGFVGFFLIVFGKKKMKSKIAFGPFLIVGLVISLFFHQAIVSLFASLYL